MNTLTKLISISLLFVIMCCKTSSKKEKITTEKQSTKSENVHIIDTTFVLNEISNLPKKVWLYLPPDYGTSTKKYPVIYMHDGQNLFDDATSFIGEWGIDETLNSIFEKTGKGFIVVAPENGGQHRTAEYTPWTHEKHGGGKGDVYVQFLKNTLKPYIDANYRTLSEAENTGLIGSSLGGLISYYGGLQYPDTFGKIGVLSPSFWYSKEVIPFTREKAQNNPSKLYFLLGGKEGMTEEFTSTISLLKDSEFPEEQYVSKIVPDGEHNETFWKSEFKNVIKFLYDI